MPSTLFRRTSLAALIAATCAASAITAQAAASTRTAYSFAVTQICAHSLLFEEPHAIGTRAGALELAGDIRSSTGRRLARVAALPAPADQERGVVRWLALEQRLADLYARNYVRVYDIIAAPMTSKQRTHAAHVLGALLSAPDPLRRQAARLQAELHVPDCTGGDS